MMTCKVKTWGNSLGLLIPKEVAGRFELHEGDELTIDIVKKGNPLKELFGSGKNTLISQESIKKSRKELSSKWW